MTNEELIILIRCGQLCYMEDLYEQNRGIIYRIARSYSSMKLTAAVDINDFMQTGYVALAAAVEGYEQSKGAFVGYLIPWLRTSMRRFVGLDGARRAHNGAVSLDEPLPGTEDITRGEALRDDNATDPYEAAELQDMQRVVRAAVDRLPDKQREIIKGYYFEGKLYTTFDGSYYQVISESKKAMATLHSDKELRRLVTASETPLYHHVSLASYRTSWNSTVELAAMKRAEIMERVNEIRRRSY